MNQWLQAQFPLLPYYDVPIIRPVATPKKKNPIIRAIKKFVYFKPKTFIGATIITTLFGIVMTSWLQEPKVAHHTKPKQQIERRVAATTTNTTQMAEMLTVFNSLYLNYQKTTQTLRCPTCGDIVSITTTSGKEIGATCLTCQKAFVPLNTTEKQHE